MALPEEGKCIGCYVQMPLTGSFDVSQAVPNSEGVAIRNAWMNGDETIKPREKGIVIEDCTTTFIRLDKRSYLAVSLDLEEIYVRVSFEKRTSKADSCSHLGALHLNIRKVHHSRLNSR